MSGWLENRPGGILYSFDSHIDLSSFSLQQQEAICAIRDLDDLSRLSSACTLGPSRRIINPGSFLGAAMLLGMFEEFNVVLPSQLRPHKNDLLAKMSRRLSPAGGKVSDREIKIYGACLQVLWSDELDHLKDESWVDVCADFFFDYEIRKSWCDLEDFQFASFSNPSGVSFIRSTLNGHLPPWHDQDVNRIAVALVGQLPGGFDLKQEILNETAQLSEIEGWFYSKCSEHPDFAEGLLGDAPLLFLNYVGALHQNNTRRTTGEELETFARLTSSEHTDFPIILYYRSNHDWEQFYRLSYRYFENTRSEEAACLFVESSLRMGEISVRHALQLIDAQMQPTGRYSRVAAAACLSIGDNRLLRRYLETSLKSYPDDAILSRLGVFLL